MEMSDIIVVCRRGQSERLDDETLATDFGATNVERLIEGCLSCTVPSYKLHEVERHASVAYVRRVQAYRGSLAS
jgi:hypothetical protein